MKRIFFLCFYYGFARFLPGSHLKLVGKICGRIRLFCAKRLFKKCANSANIERMSSFGDGHDIEIGEFSGLGKNSHVPNNIIIGDNVMMGPYVFVTDNVTHNYNRVDIPMIHQGSRIIKERTIIGNDVWIGRQVLILCGKKIGAHSIIGAGSVVAKDIDEYSVAVGNPCRVVKKRGEADDKRDG